MGKRGIPLPVQVVIAAGVGALVALVVVRANVSMPDVQSFFAADAGTDLSGDDRTDASAGTGPRTACVIKGNVSINSGKHIYHVPGQKFYDATNIRPEYGERWFCTEAEARAAGWQRARR